MPKATIYIRVKNWQAWKALGKEPARWVNEKLEEHKAEHTWANPKEINGMDILVVPAEPVWLEDEQRWSDSD